MCPRCAFRSRWSHRKPGLTPTKKVKDELPASADLNTAISLYDKYSKELKPLEKEQIAQWFKTWDGGDLGEIPLAVLKGEMEDGVEPITDAEVRIADYG